MILTITLNPSVDIGYHLDYFSLDTVNRVNDVSKTAGGKGINVARVLQQLKEDVAASGFLGGSLGDFIRSEIHSLGIQDFFVEIEGATRNCIAVIHEGNQTEILESGPTITADESDQFLENFKNHLHGVEVITVSGSLPKGLSDDFYVKLLEIAHQRNIRLLLDVNGDLLTSTLMGNNKPYLIKPNQDEFANFIGEKSVDTTQIIQALKTKKFVDIPWVIVTLGKDGAIVKSESKLYQVNVPIIKAINPVGSGDSVIAGFAAGLSRHLEDEYLIKFGLCMGVLNALEEKTGYINVDKIDELLGQIEIEIIE